MKYYGMDPTLVEIYNIRNIESIKLWDLVSHDESNKRIVIPAFMVIYDGGKQLNLCAKDKYFDIFVKKITEVYRDEKNNILEDALTDPFGLSRHIEIDDFTKSVLESGDLTVANEIYGFYKDKERYEGSLFYQVDEVKSLVKIIQYHIKRLFANTDRNVNFNDEFSGYRNNYVMSGQIDGIDQYFPFTFQKVDSNHYEIWVNGLVNQNLPVRVDVIFKKDELDVVVEIEPYELKEESRYVITNGVVKSIHDATRRGITIGYKNNDLEKMETNPLDNIANLDEEVNLDWFILPWGAVYGCASKIEDVSGYEKVIEIHNMYLDVFDGGFVRKEYYSKNYKRNRTVSLNAQDVVLEEIKKNILGISIDKEGKIFVVETSFDEGDVSNDFYNGAYGGKFFYHGCYTENGVSGIDRKRLVTLNKEKNVLNNSDLVNKYRILKLVKGE